MSKKKKILKVKREKFTDESLMLFGKHKGTKLANVPDSYCMWLLDQNWIKDHPALYAYLKDNEDSFMPNECIDLY